MQRVKSCYGLEHKCFNSTPTLAPPSITTSGSEIPCLKIVSLVAATFTSKFLLRSVISTSYHNRMWNNFIPYSFILIFQTIKTNRKRERNCVVVLIKPSQRPQLDATSSAGRQYNGINWSRRQTKSCVEMPMVPTDSWWVKQDHRLSPSVMQQLRWKKGYQYSLSMNHRPLDPREAQ